MKLVSFDPLRLWNVPGVQYIKPDNWERSLDVIRAADWVLFPEYRHLSLLIYGMRKRVFPSPSSYFLGHSKVEMTYAFQANFAENTPYTRILIKSGDGIEAILEDFGYPFVAKEIHSSMGRGVHLIENRRQFLEYAERVNVLYAQEVLTIDRDVRVVIVGRDVVTAYWRIAPEGGFHNNVALGAEVSFVDVPEQAIAFALSVAHALDIDHAGFDIAMVNGKPYLLEFNLRFGNEALRSARISVGPAIMAYLQAQSGTPNAA